MMYENEIIEVKIANANIKYYENLLDTILKIGEIIYLEQNKLPLSSRMKVKCKCELCDKDFYRMRKDVKVETYCGTKCRNEYLKSLNPNLEIELIKVKCETCNIDFEVVPSKYKKQDNFLCSRECYKIHRSNKYNKNNTYNYQDIKGNCTLCEKEIKLIESDKNFRKNRFCSQECYWKHRRINYKEQYYVKNFFDRGKKETIPERKIREFLESNNIKYVQEYNLLNYYIDFYLPEKNIAIEVYGDYWYVNPKIYGKGKKKLHKNQLGVREYDNKRNEELKSIVKEVIILWEYDINNDFDNCVGAIINKII